MWSHDSMSAPQRLHTSQFSVSASVYDEDGSPSWLNQSQGDAGEITILYGGLTLQLEPGTPLINVKNFNSSDMTWDSKDWGSCKITPVDIMKRENLVKGQNWWQITPHFLLLASIIRIVTPVSQQGTIGCIIYRAASPWSFPNWDQYADTPFSSGITNTHTQTSHINTECVWESAQPNTDAVTHEKMPEPIHTMTLSI